MRKPAFCIHAKTKMQTSCAVTALILYYRSSFLYIFFVFATLIEQSLYLQDPGFHVCGCTAWFVSDFVENTQNRFSHDVDPWFKTGLNWLLKKAFDLQKL